MKFQQGSLNDTHLKTTRLHHFFKLGPFIRVSGGLYRNSMYFGFPGLASVVMVWEFLKDPSFGVRENFPISHTSRSVAPAGTNVRRRGLGARMAPEYAPPHEAIAPWPKFKNVRRA